MNAASLGKVMTSAVGNVFAQWANLHGSSLEQFREKIVDLWEQSANLSPKRRKALRRAASLALMLLPAVDPTTDPWLKHSLGTPRAPRTDGSVLITGATGFVGIHLLAFLLQETDRRVVCVVRDPAKIARIAEEYGLTLPDLESRVSFLPGNMRDLTRWIREKDSAWEVAAREIGMVFHLACNTSFTSQYEILRREWMPVFAELCRFCARSGAAMHLVGSVGRFAVNGQYRTARGAWTSCYMRLKHVQCELAQRFLEEGMAGSVIDCAYVIGSQERGLHPGMHDSLWLVAAMQTLVGASFPGDAAVVPVDLLVRGIWRNATLPPERAARYMNLRLQRLLTSDDIGISQRLSPADFRALAKEKSLPNLVIDALVPDDIDDKVRLMNSRPFEGPPEVLEIFAGIDEGAILQKSVAHARPNFGQIHERLQRLL